MKASYTHITIVLDRSGSMLTRMSDTIGGFNTFLKTQQAAPGEATLSLVLFDHEYDMRYHVRPVAQVPPLDEATYTPRGNTALLDAMGRAITYTGELLRLRPEDERPAKVVFVVITDGEENSSREFSKAQIAEMVRKQTDTYKWEFVYLGADQDAITVAHNYGFKGTHATTFVPSGVTAFNAYNVLADKVNTLRASAMFVGEDSSFAPFTPAERASMVASRDEEDDTKKAPLVPPAD